MNQDSSMKPRKIDPKLALLLAACIVALVGVSFFIVIQVMKKNSNTAMESPKTTSEIGTALTLVAGASELAVNESTDIAVILENTPAQAVDIVITFDPNLVSISNVQNGSVYPSIVRQDIRDSQLVVSTRVDADNSTDLKAGDVFSFTVTALAPGNAHIGVNKDLSITATKNKNTLEVVNDADITIK